MLQNSPTETHVLITKVEFMVVGGLISLMLALIGFLWWNLFNAKISEAKAKAESASKDVTELGQDVLKLSVDLANGLEAVIKQAKEDNFTHMSTLSARVGRLETNELKTSDNLNNMRIMQQELKVKVENQGDMLVRMEKSIDLVLRNMGDLMAVIGNRRKSDA